MEHARASTGIYSFIGCLANVKRASDSLYKLIRGSPKWNMRCSANQYSDKSSVRHWADMFVWQKNHFTVSQFIFVLFHNLTWNFRIPFSLLKETSNPQTNPRRYLQFHFTFKAWISSCIVRMKKDQHYTCLLILNLNLNDIFIFDYFGVLFDS